MKKTSMFSKALSVFLAVLMVVTAGMTGLYPLAEYANAAIEKTEYQGAPVFSLKFNVPESIYLKPGTGEFQYFLTNQFSSVGADANANVQTACDVTAVAPLAKSMTLTYALESTGKKPDGSSVSASGLSVNIASSVSGDQSLTNTLTGKALSGYTDAIAGNEYFIKWTLTFKVDINGSEETFTQYAYTSIYVPSLLTAGDSLYFKASPTIGIKPRNSAYSFLTGGHSVSGGNGYASSYTSSNVAGAEANKTITKSNLANATYIAPLILMTGGNPHSDSDDIDNIPTNPFSAGATVPAGNGMFRNGTIKAQANGGVYVNSESYGNGQWFQVSDLNATNAPTLNITVDASRFTNYSQIPNLSAGWMEYATYKHGDCNQLRWIAGVYTGASYDGSVAKNALEGDDAKKVTIQGGKTAVSAIGVDTTSETKNYVSLARGPYKLSGAVQNGHNSMMFAYRNAADGVVATSTNAVVAGADLNVTTVNKAALRNAVYSTYENGYGVKTSSSDAVKAYFNAINAGSKVLADQFATSAEVTSAANAVNSAFTASVKTTVENAVKFEADAYDIVAFNVPETIYLTPTQAASSTYQYALDQNMTVTGTTLDNGTVQHTASITPNTGYKTLASGQYGNIQFFYSGVDTSKPVTLTCSDSGATVTAFTTLPTARSATTASSSTVLKKQTSAVPSGLFCRTPTSLPAASWKTSATGGSTPATRTA